MPHITLTKSDIEDDLEQIGADIRPALDLRAEREKLFEYARLLTDKWPEVYENIVQGPSKFVITKQFSFPGKGDIETPTFILTPRGPVFMFPRILGALREETSLPSASDVVLPALEHLSRIWALCKCIRLGVVHIYVFGCKGQNALQMIAQRFTKISVPEEGELTLRVNRPDADFNRIMEIGTAQGYTVQPAGPQPPGARNLRVKADFNNRDMSKEVPADRLAAILVHGQEFCKTEVLDFLNREEAEE